jgi:gliding motility-associated-like protein
MRENVLKICLSILILLLALQKLPAQYFLKNAGSAVIDEGMAICVHSNGNNYTVGYISGQANFGNINITPTGLSDGFLSCANAQGDIIWVQKISGSGIDKCVGIASNGNNIVVTGTFEGVLTIGPHTVASAGLNDVFIAQYDGNGNILWLNRMGGIGNELVSDVVADLNNNVVIAGSFIGIADFGPTQLQSTLNNGISTNDMFVSKLDSTGNFIWTKQAICTGDDKATDVVTDANGAVIVCGTYSDSLTLDVLHPNVISNVGCVFKLDANSNEQWFLSCIASSLTPAALAVDVLNRIVFVGHFSGTLTTLSSPQQNIGGTYTHRIFIMQIDGSGNIQWIKSHSSTGLLRATDVKCTTSNDVILLGEYHCRMNEFADVYGQGIFNSVGYSDVFVCKNKADGTFDWARCMGGPSNDYAPGLALDINNGIYFTGSFDKRFSAPFQNTAGCLNSGTAAVYCSDINYSSYCQITNANNTTGNRDIIYAKCINTQRQPYDYFIRQGSSCQRSTLNACIIEQLSQSSCNDSSTICANNSAYLSASARTDGLIGPSYTYQWSNGSIGNILITGGGTYTVTVTTEDGCFSSIADMHVSVVNPPNFPLISDSKGINNQASIPQKIIICAPDSVVIWASNITPGNTYFWSVNGVVIYDDTITVNQNAICSFTTGTNTLCPVTNYVEVQVVQNTNSIHRINVINAVNDTVSNCSNNVHVAFIDSVTSVCYKDSVFWSITPMQAYNIGGFPCFNMATMSFIPDTNGWYLISCYGFNAQCGGDTVGPVTVKIYFEKQDVLPPQNITITGMRPICPVGDTITLTASGAVNYNWSGPNIIGNLTDSSIQITSIGTYTVTSAQFSVDSCLTYSSAGILITTKPSPQLFVTPSDGIICPNDSVQLGGNINGYYTWYGPNGLLPDTSFVSYASLPGTYFFSVLDSMGCNLISNTAAINNYSTPTLLASNTYVCSNSSVAIQLITAGGVWSWMPPLSGNDTTVYINTPGTYQCAVLSCGITSILDVTITAPTFTTAIQSPATTICIGDSALLIAPPGYSYVWQHNLNTNDSIYVTTAGFYAVQLTDNDGCTMLSDSISITLALPPATPTATANNAKCEGDTIQLFTAAVNGLSYLWTGPNNFISTAQNPILAPASTLSSGIYTLQLFDGGCGSGFVQVPILINNNQATPIITSNQPACIGDTIWLNAAGSNLQWYGPLNFQSTDSSIILLQATVNQSGWYYCIATGLCNSLPDSVLISIHAVPATPAIIGSSSSCNYDTLFLNTHATALNYSWIGPQGLTGNQASFVVYPPVAGNYYLVVSNGNCVSDTASHTLQLVAPPPAPLLSANDTVCQGSYVILEVINPTSLMHTWFGPDSLNFTGNVLQIQQVTLGQGGKYYVYASNGCLSDSSITNLQVDTLPVVVSISPIQNICIGDSLILNADALNHTELNWYYGNQLIAQQEWYQKDSINTFDAGYYILQLTNGVCMVSDSVKVTVSDCDITLPNVLTPNQDGFNDTWTLESDAVSNWQLQIFNRWGKPVYNNTGSKIVWTGTDNNGHALTDGTYFYLIKYIENKVSKTSKGQLTIIK